MECGVLEILVGLLDHSDEVTKVNSLWALMVSGVVVCDL